MLTWFGGQLQPIEPLDARVAGAARQHQTPGGAVLDRKRLAVHLVGQQGYPDLGEGHGHNVRPSARADVACRRQRLGQCQHVGQAQPTPAKAWNAPALLAGERLLDDRWRHRCPSR